MKTDVSAYGVTELSPEESSSTAGGFWPIVAIIAGVGAIIGAATSVGVVIGAPLKMMIGAASRAS